MPTAAWTEKLRHEAAFLLPARGRTGPPPPAVPTRDPDQGSHGSFLPGSRALPEPVGDLWKCPLRSPSVFVPSPPVFISLRVIQAAHLTWA